MRSSGTAPHSWPAEPRHNLAGRKMTLVWFLLVLLQCLGDIYPGPARLQRAQKEHEHFTLKKGKSILVLPYYLGACFPTEIHPIKAFKHRTLIRDHAHPVPSGEVSKTSKGGLQES